MFNAYMIHNRKEWYRFLSNGVIHADWVHLLFNMYALWMFGGVVEKAFCYDAVFGGKGEFFFVLLYVGGLVMSSLYAYEKHKNNVYYNSLGASGAVSAVIFAYIILAPTARLGFMFIPVPIPAYLFGFIILGIEHYLSRRGNTGISNKKIHTRGKYSRCQIASSKSDGKPELYAQDQGLVPLSQ